MSHNVQITGIKINNLDALDKACAELRKEGINVSLERGKGSRSLRFRNFSYVKTNDPTADHVIRLPDAPYDIGLVRAPAGHYEPVYDNALGISVRCPIACEYKPDNQFNYRPITTSDELALASKGVGIGKLMQRYTAVVTETEARRRGFMTRRVTNKDGGLEIVMRR